MFSNIRAKMCVMLPGPVVANVLPGLAFSQSRKPLKSSAGAVFLAEITNGLMDTRDSGAKSATGSY